MSAHRALQDVLAAPFAIPDPATGNTITVDRDRCYVPLVSVGAAETRTLAAPTKAGPIVVLGMKTDAGDIVVTVTGTYDGSSTAITFDDVGDWVALVAINTTGTTFAWRVLAGAGTNVAGYNATTAVLTTMNATSATVTNINSTTSLPTTCNASNSTIVNCNITTGTITTATVGKLSVTAAAVTAAGDAITNAANLSYGMNVVTASDNAKGVILPVATANGIVEILQTVNAKSLLVYRQVNSTIAGLAANAALSTGVCNTAATAGTTQNVHFKFIATNATQWYVSK
jgi:hypothetical protein